MRDVETATDPKSLLVRVRVLINVVTFRTCIPGQTCHVVLVAVTLTSPRRGRTAGLELVMVFLAWTDGRAWIMLQAISRIPALAS